MFTMLLLNETTHFIQCYNVVLGIQCKGFLNDQTVSLDNSKEDYKMYTGIQYKNAQILLAITSSVVPTMVPGNPIDTIIL